MQVLARHVLTFLRSFYACSQKYKKVWHFLRKTLDICLQFGYNNTRRQGHGPRRKEYADVAELADALDSGSSSLKRVWVQIPSSAPNESKTNTRQPLKWSVMCSFCFVLFPHWLIDNKRGAIATGGKAAIAPLFLLYKLWNFCVRIYRFHAKFYHIPYKPVRIW